MKPHKNTSLHVTNEWLRKRTLGQRIADGIAAAMGSWAFVIGQSVFIAGWMILNVLAFVRHWDPRPWIILNLVFSIQAAYAAPLILMSQRRQDAVNKIRDDKDFDINMHSADTVDEILRKVDKMASIMGVTGDTTDR